MPSDKNGILGSHFKKEGRVEQYLALPSFFGYLSIKDYTTFYCLSNRLTSGTLRLSASICHSPLSFC